MEQPPNAQPPAPVNVQHQPSERHHSSDNSYYASDGRSTSRSNNVPSGKADDYHHPNARPSRKRFSFVLLFLFFVCFLIDSFIEIVLFDRG